MKYTVSKIFFCLTLIFSISFSQLVSPKFETRAVWISAASGDWPTSTNVEEQQRSLREMFDNIRALKLNTIFFQVRPRGNTLYHSEIEPWATQLTGVLGKDPEWDPLEFAIAEAHKRGLELHAWFNVAKIFNADIPVTHPKHLLRSHPEWMKKFGNEWWIDMGIPAVREYTQNLVMELVHNYDIDGVHLDYLRYPGEKFDDWKTFREFSDGVERSEWRRNNLTTFVRSCYDAIMKEKPYIKIGSSPLGIYQAIDGAQSSFSGYSGVYQDSRRWLREGIHDYIVPQLYWTFGEQRNPYDPDFAALCNDWVRERYGRNVFIGIGAYQEQVRNEVAEQVQFTREVKAQGQSIFHYENLAQVHDELLSAYRFRAIFAQTPWKDSVPPLPPENIKVIYDESATIIKWNEPDKASDGELPFWYILYRSSDEEVNTQAAGTILAVLPATQTSYRDESVQIQGKKYFYTVTSLDRCGNESSTNTKQSGEISNALSHYVQRSAIPLLAENFPNPFVERTYIVFELPKRSFVMLSFKNTVSQKETLVVKETKEAGTHIISIDGKNFPKGMYEYQLRTDDVVMKRTMEKK